MERSAYPTGHYDTMRTMARVGEYTVQVSLKLNLLRVFHHVTECSSTMI